MARPLRAATLAISSFFQTSATIHCGEWWLLPFLGDKGLEWDKLRASPPGGAVARDDPTIIGERFRKNSCCATVRYCLVEPDVIRKRYFFHRK